MLSLLLMCESLSRKFFDASYKVFLILVVKFLVACFYFCRTIVGQKLTYRARGSSFKTCRASKLKTWIKIKTDLKTKNVKNQKWPKNEKIDFEGFSAILEGNPAILEGNPAKMTQKWNKIPPEIEINYFIFRVGTAQKNAKNFVS